MRRLLHSLVRAARRAPRTTVLILAGLVALATSTVLFLGASEDVIRHNGASRLDAQRLDWFTDHRSQPLIAVARFVNTAGSVGVVALLAVVAGAWLWKRGLPLAVTVAPLVSVLLAETAAAFLKVVVDRSRPPLSVHLVSEADPSFPSGHATAATAFGISLAIIVAVFVLVHTWSRVTVLAAGLVVPVIVGLSRLELGVHWPTDVAAGLALGAATALTVSGLALWFANRRHDRDDAATAPGWRLRASRLFAWRRQTDTALRRLRLALSDGISRSLGRWRPRRCIGTASGRTRITTTARIGTWCCRSGHRRAPTIAAVIGICSESSHSHGLVDPAVIRSRAGERAVAISLAVLGLTAVLQLLIFLATGSVALRADLIP